MTAISRFTIEQISGKVVKLYTSLQYGVPVPTSWIDKDVILMLRLKAVPVSQGHGMVVLPEFTKSFDGKVLTLRLADPVNEPSRATYEVIKRE